MELNGILIAPPHFSPSWAIKHRHIGPYTVDILASIVISETYGFKFALNVMQRKALYPRHAHFNPIKREQGYGDIIILACSWST
jgi:hypothetical protein